jgi:hypothetical protein
MMTNPYRADSARVSARPSHGCVVCRARAALAHVNWLRVAAWTLAGVLSMISVASAAFAYESLTMNARMMAAAEAEVLGAAAAVRDRTPRTAPVPLVPLYPNPPNAVSVCTSVEREVDRDVLLAALREDLPQRPAIVPEVSNRKVVGLRVFGILEGSRLSRLGLVNGDLVLSVNGSDLGSPEKALDVYGRMQTAEEIVVELSRGGEPRELRYHVRPGAPSAPRRRSLAQKSTSGSKPVVGAVAF